MGGNIFILGELNVDLIITGEDVIPEFNKEKLIDRFDQVLDLHRLLQLVALRD